MQVDAENTSIQSHECTVTCDSTTEAVQIYTRNELQSTVGGFATGGGQYGIGKLEVGVIPVTLARFHSGTSKRLHVLL